MLKTFRERPGKLTKGGLFHKDNLPAHEHVVAMAAVCVTVALNWLFALHILLIWHHPTIFCSPTWKKKKKKKKKKIAWLGNSIGPMMRSYLQLRTLSRIRMRVGYHGNPSVATMMVEVCEPRGRLCRKTRHIIMVKFDLCIIVCEPFSPPS